MFLHQAYPDGSGQFQGPSHSTKDVSRRFVLVGHDQATFVAWVRALWGGSASEALFVRVDIRDAQAGGAEVESGI